MNLRLRKAGALCAAGLAVAFLAAACSSSKTSTGASSHTTYKVGVIASLSGTFASLGPDVVHGAQIAVDEANAASSGPKFSVDVVDDQSSPPVAVAGARKLIADGVIAIVGPDGTPTMLAVDPVVLAANIPTIFVTPSAYPNYNREFYLFSAPQPSINDNVLKVFQFLKARGVSKVGLVLGNDALGTLEAKAAEAASTATGLATASVTVPTSSPDYSSSLATLRSQGAQAIFSGMTGPSSATVRNDQVQLGWNVPYFTHNGNTAGSFVSLLGNNAQGAYWYVLRSAFPPSALPSGAARTLITKVLNDYQSHYHAAPVNVTAVSWAYDSVESVIKAVQGGAHDHQALANALEHQSFVAINGDVHRTPTDHDGVGISGSYLATWENGHFVPVNG